jgi:hypothetical protein
MVSRGLQTIKSRVEDFLRKDPRTRDSDNLLIARIWYEEVSETLPIVEFLKKFSTGSYTSPESIRRVRQKTQELNPELRGKSYKERKTTLENNFRSEINKVE